MNYSIPLTFSLPKEIPFWRAYCVKRVRPMLEGRPPPKPWELLRGGGGVRGIGGALHPKGAHMGEALQGQGATLGLNTG